MRTRSSSSNLVGKSSLNPTTSKPKCHNRRHSKQPFILEESPVDTMADQRTMTELLHAPTEGYAEAIVIPPILAEHFELKHSLINMMTSDQFFGLEKDNPHDHIRAARRWLEKEPLCSILTLEDLISKFINEFFPPSRTTNLHNEISTFQQRFDESFHEAWDHYKDLLRACPHHGFTELHQLDTFYNALNPTDQDSLNSAAGGNLLERRTHDVLTIIENKSKVRNSQNKKIVSQVKSSDDNSSSSSEIAKLTHAVNQQTSDVTTCLAADGNTFPEFRDNIQGYVSTAAVNYNHGNSGYRPPMEKIKKMNGINIKAMQNQINNVKNELRNEMKTLIQSSISNQTNELKNMMASFFRMNNVSTSSSGPLPSNTIANPKAVILKKLPEKLGDPEKFLIQCGLSELKCKAVSDLDPNDNLFDTIPEMFIDEHTLDYSSPPLYDEYNDDLVELEFDNDDVYDDPFDSKEDKIKESKLLINELDLPRSSDFLPSPEYDSFLFEDFSKVYALPSTNNEDKVFNPGILIQENFSEVTIRVAPDKNVKKISSSNASLIIEDFNPPLHELPFHKKVPGSKTLLSFSSENKEKVFKLDILTSEGVHTDLL
nr:hypothetical protein [Tanacetum cinerariifolium]